MSNPFMHLSRLELIHEIGVRKQRLAKLNSQLYAAAADLEYLEESLLAKVNSDTPTTGSGIASLGVARQSPDRQGGGQR